MEVAKGFFEVVKQISTLFRLHYNIINVNFIIPSGLSLQDDLYDILIRSLAVFDVEHHLCVTEDSKWDDERCIFFIVNG
jgi:hypothetical protein